LRFRVASSPHKVPTFFGRLTILCNAKADYPGLAF
jgi:hypothetical protein